MEFDQYFIVRDLWYGSFLIEFQAVETIEALDGPGHCIFGDCRHLDMLEVCMCLFANLSRRWRGIGGF